MEPRTDCPLCGEKLLPYTQMKDAPYWIAYCENCPGSRVYEMWKNHVD